MDMWFCFEKGAMWLDCQKAFKMCNLFHL
jgi:hypothetical protein